MLFKTVFFTLRFKRHNHKGAKATKLSQLGDQTINHAPWSIN